MFNSKKISANSFETSRFYQLPKFLFEDKYFSKMSTDAKVMYALLKDRFELSRVNNWVDEESNIYLLYTNKQLCSILQYSEPKVIKLKKELAKHKLIISERQGLNRPNKIYLLEPSYNLELKNYKFQNKENISSGTKDYLVPELKIDKPNDTELNDTDFNKTEYNDHHHRDAQSENNSDKQSKNTKLKNSSDDGEESLQSVLNAYKDSFDKVPSQNISKKLQKDIEQNGTELVLYAINEAMEKDKTNYSYVKGILRRLHDRNIKSRKQAESYQHHKQSQQQIQSKEITPEWLHNKYSNQEKKLTSEEQKQFEKDRKAFIKHLNEQWG